MILNGCAVVNFKVLLLMLGVDLKTTLAKLPSPENVSADNALVIESGNAMLVNDVQFANAEL